MERNVWPHLKQGPVSGQRRTRVLLRRTLARTGRPIHAFQNFVCRFPAELRRPDFDCELKIFGGDSEDHELVQRCMRPPHDDHTFKISLLVNMLYLIINHLNLVSWLHSRGRRRGNRALRLVRLQAANAGHRVRRVRPSPAWGTAAADKRVL